MGTTSSFCGLALFSKHVQHDVCFLWVRKGVEQNYGKEIKDMLSGHPEEKVIIHDTALL